MLTLKLFRFRCWDDLQLTFAPGKITLLRGASGSGKSTIFAAIAWCLFGNVRLVAPLTNEKAKTAVTLSTCISGQEVTIVRSRNPQRLLVRLSQNGQETVYEDKVAAAIVEGLFGKYEVWIASCYLAQNCRNSFLGVSNSAKLQLLEDIAFLQEDPKLYIERIEAEIAAREVAYKEASVTFRNTLQAWEAEFADCTIKYLVTEADIKALQDAQTEVAEELAVEQNKLLTYSVKQELLTKLAEEEAEIPAAEDPGAGNVDLAVIRRTLPLLYQLETIRGERERLVSQLPVEETIPCTEDDYDRAREVEQVRSQTLTLCQRLQVVYTEHAIDEARNVCSAALERESELERLHAAHGAQANYQKYHDKLQVLTKQLTTMEEEICVVGREPLPALVPPVYNVDTLHQQVASVQQEITRLLVVIEKIKESEQVLPCPHCRENVHFVHGKLLASADPSVEANLAVQTRSLQSSRALYQQYSEEIVRRKTSHASDMDRYRQDMQRRSTILARMRDLETAYRLLQEKIASCQGRIRQEEALLASLGERDLTVLPPLLPAAQRRQLQDRFHVLDNLRFLPAPVPSSEVIRAALRWRDAENRDAALREKEEALHARIDKEHWMKSPGELQALQEEEEKRLRLLRIFQDSNQRRARIHKHQEELLVQRGENPQPRITALQEEQATLLASEAEYIQMHRAHLQLNKVSEQRAALTVQHAELTAYCLLREKARTCECHILQQAVDSINASVSSICTDLFTTDMSMSLQLYKEVKSTKEVKPTVNFTIAYREGLFDNINQLSGGEGDRVSLALTLGLNTLSTCPFLLLDETLGSLDSEMKMEAIETIASNTNKAVLLVMHDGVEGVFDGVVNMDELSK